jgi:DNA-binding response OmpR family regulator
MAQSACGAGRTDTLPGVTNGFELGRLARQARPELKVIAASGNRSMASGGHCIDAFFDKPYSVDVIVARIHALLGLLSGEHG